MSEPRSREIVQGDRRYLRVSTSTQPLPHRGRWPRRWFWLLVGLIAATGIAVTLDRTVFSGGTQALSSAPKDVQDSVQALVSGSIPGAILFVRQGDRSYTVMAGYADKAKKVRCTRATSSRSAALPRATPPSWSCAWSRTCKASSSSPGRRSRWSGSRQRSRCFCARHAVLVLEHELHRARPACGAGRRRAVR
jgi:hypothetical protein